MSTVKAYYNGMAFVPIEPIAMTKGEIVRLSIVQEPSAGAEAAKKLAAFRALTEEIHQLNLEEPFTPEFDAILSQRVNFTKELDL